ncbi:T9SS type A sorting domain-containing protein [Lewinella cohaerens]|uniref:T9SS type A sorting domain-containing protein n=1 Tax=Lewinella cohaerens TaxID=70995 RepID=UPI0003699C8B|nr:T9SS type A sorting domain-containing protein [Lewinella cohaerens]
MKQLVRLSLLPLCFFFSHISQISAFDIWGIEIQAQQTGLLSIDASIVVYIKGAAVQTDGFRDSLSLSWGDGTISRVAISNNADINGDGFPDGTPVDENFIKYIYSGAHTYATMDRYLLSVENPNRGNGIINVNFPNSISINLYTESEITLTEDYEHNHLPVFLETPTNYAFIGQQYLHLPNAFDIDDDSLVYELVVPKQGPNDPVPNYFGIGSLATIDSETGTFYALIDQAGTYTFAIQVSSYRNGMLMDRVVRDMKFFVEDTDGENDRPSFQLNTPLTVIQQVSVGDTVRFQAIAQDDNTTIPAVRATSGLFDYYAEPASINIDLAVADFEWIVREEHVRAQPYPVVLRAKDDGYVFGYANFALVRYRVSGGPTSTDDLPESPTLTLYPNPANGWLRVDMSPSLATKVINYQVFTYDGKWVLSGAFRGNSEQLEVGMLPAGMYLLQYEIERKLYQQRFVIQ